MDTKLQEAQEKFEKNLEKQATVRAEVKSDESSEGYVSAAFSIFDVLDEDGDVVLRSAFTDGQEVPMVWSHNWAMPVGKGTIRVEEDRAVFRGNFFLDTQNGSEAYKTVKNMGQLQEWSWGFRIKDYDIEEDENAPFGYKRIIKQADVFEVSPVLVGANRETRTLSIKSDHKHIRDLIQTELDKMKPEIIEQIKVAMSDSSAKENEETTKNEESLQSIEESDNISEEEKSDNQVLAEAIKEAARYETLRYEYRR